LWSTTRHPTAPRRHWRVSGNHANREAILNFFLHHDENRGKGAGIREWRELFGRMGVHEIRTVTDIGLYPVPFNLIFGRGLHFISILEAS
jgi:hypothetical protein